MTPEVYLPLGASALSEAYRETYLNRWEFQFVRGPQQYQLPVVCVEPYGSWEMKLHWNVRCETNGQVFPEGWDVFPGNKYQVSKDVGEAFVGSFLRLNNQNFMTEVLSIPVGHFGFQTIYEMVDGNFLPKKDRIACLLRQAVLFAIPREGQLPDLLAVDYAQATQADLIAGFIRAKQNS